MKWRYGEPVWVERGTWEEARDFLSARKGHVGRTAADIEIS